MDHKCPGLEKFKKSTRYSGTEITGGVMSIQELAVNPGSDNLNLPASKALNSSVHLNISYCPFCGKKLGKAKRKN